MAYSDWPGWLVSSGLGSVCNLDPAKTFGGLLWLGGLGKRLRSGPLGGLEARKLLLHRQSTTSISSPPSFQTLEASGPSSMLHAETSLRTDVIMVHHEMVRQRQLCDTACVELVNELEHGRQANQLKM